MSCRAGLLHYSWTLLITAFFVSISFDEASPGSSQLQAPGLCAQPGSGPRILSHREVAIAEEVGIISINIQNPSVIAVQYNTQPYWYCEGGCVSDGVL